MAETKRKRPKQPKKAQEGDVNGNDAGEQPEPFRPHLADPRFVAALEVLDPREQRWLLRYIEHGNASKASREAGYATVGAHVQGHRLLNRSKIVEVLKVYRELSAARIELTPEQHMQELADLRDMAKLIGWQDRQAAALSAAIKAEQLRGHMKGFYVDRRMDMPGEAMSDEEVASQAERLGI